LKVVARIEPPVAPAPKPPPSWLLLVYRVPTEPSRNRVAIWREMKRIGALYVQNCVCLLPNFRGMKQRLKSVAQKVESLGGSSNLFEIPQIEAAQLGDIIGNFRSLSDREYMEIVEECETKFKKEIEFERFRKNYSYEEAEEILTDLEKIRSWLQRVRDRDWFSSERRTDAERSLAECEELYELFERDCYAAEGEHGDMGKAPDEELLRTASEHASRRAPRRRRASA
jgi:hypothetical protein